MYVLDVNRGLPARIRPSKYDLKFNGITAADAARIQQHVTFIDAFDDPIQLIAADVDKSKTVTLLDAILVSQALLGNPSANLIWKESWRFVDASYSFPNPEKPWGFPEQIALDRVDGPVEGVNFLGIKLGDVAAPNANPGWKVGPVVMSTSDRLLQAGETIEVLFAVRGVEEIAAIQCALDFDPEVLQFYRVQTPDNSFLAADNFGLWSVQNGTLRLVYAMPEGESLPNGADFFSVQFTVLKGGQRLSQHIRLNDEVLPAEACTAGFDFIPVYLSVDQSTGVSSGPASLGLTLRPNPAVQTTEVFFDVPYPTDVRLRLLDGTGQTVHVFQASMVAGEHRYRMELPAAGVYTVELVAGHLYQTARVVATR